MKLIIFHHHFRPGGVRRVIEQAAPHLARALRPCLRELVLAGGEAPDDSWWQNFCKSLADLPGLAVSLFLEPAFGYAAEQNVEASVLSRQCARALHRLLAGAQPEETVVWAHNLGLGRNLLFNEALFHAGAARGFRLLVHHHDWWFDQRWARWPEIRRGGFHSLVAVAQATFGPACSRHLAINHEDARLLRRSLGPRTAWLPDLVEPIPPFTAERLHAVRQWLVQQLQSDRPVWILPCRLLRRKNVGEALLLTRWLRPEACLVTTGGASSATEQTYAEKLAAAARIHGWPLKLALLQGPESDKPSVPELLAVSEAVLLTSLQEGFGLPCLEAAVARRPLFYRRLANVTPDLLRFGFRFEYDYGDLLVDPSLFNWEAERQRQAERFEAWLKQLPHSCRRLTGRPALLAATQPRPVAFSRLTLEAQLEVLDHPPNRSWKQCLPLNRYLASWREQSSQGRLAPML